MPDPATTPEAEAQARAIVARALGWGFDRASGMANYDQRYEELTTAIAEALTEAHDHLAAVLRRCAGEDCGGSWAELRDARTYLAGQEADHA